MRRGLTAVLLVGLATLAAAPSAATPRPAAPTVLGPRETESPRPVYRFVAARAVGFRCAFDSPRLHRCAARYAERLAPGQHVLRVRSVARDGRLSRLVTVGVRVLTPLPALAVGSPIPVGPGAGVPAVGEGEIWVPTTGDGMLVRVSGGAVVSRTRVAAPGGDGFLDTAVRAGGSVWSASDAGSRVLRIDPATGRVTRSTPLLPPFPVAGSVIESWWLAYGEGSVWATLPNHHALARIDAATGAVRYIALRQGQPFGVAVGGGSAWVATDRAVVRLDAASGRALGASSLPAAERSGFVSVAYGDGAAWLTNYDRGTLVRVTAAS